MPRSTKLAFLIFPPQSPHCHIFTLSLNLQHFWRQTWLLRVLRGKTSLCIECYRACFKFVKLYFDTRKDVLFQHICVSKI